LSDQHQTSSYQQQRPSIYWGRCPQLQPSYLEKMKKAEVITKCLENTPVPDNITRETIELHRELVAACALREEGWFIFSENAANISESLTTAMKAAAAEVTAKSVDSSTSINTATTNTTANVSSTDEELDEDLLGYSAIFSGAAFYNYSKAETEIRNKHLMPDIENQVLKYHENCRDDAKKMYSNPMHIISQIQYFQSCMDKILTHICQIQIM